MPKFELSIPEAQTIVAALRFAIDMSDTYYALAPDETLGGPDYNNGSSRLQRKRELIAEQLHYEIPKMADLGL